MSIGSRTIRNFAYNWQNKHWYDTRRQMECQKREEDKAVDQAA